MFQYRQVLVRLRAGDTTRLIARSGLMGRDKLGELRTLALSQGWLDSGNELPDDEAIAAALRPGRRASSTISSVEPFRQAVQRWVDAGVQSRAIHAALRREHGFTGSYSAVVRMARSLRAARPPEVTVRLSFAPAEAAQVDFGAGPVLTHPDGKPRRTWAFVMTLCHSRHQYVEFVWDQSSATWLGCHRRAFEWFDGKCPRVPVLSGCADLDDPCGHDEPGKELHRCRQQRRWSSRHRARRRREGASIGERTRLALSHPRSFWQEHERRRAASGLSIAQYCEQHGLACSTLRRWSAQLRGRGAGPRQKRSRETKSPTSPAAFLSVPIVPVQNDSGGGARDALPPIEVLTRNGARVRLFGQAAERAMILSSACRFRKF